MDEQKQHDEDRAGMYIGILKKFGVAILGELQKIGQSLVLPIAVLPIAGIFLRLGQDDLLNNDYILKAGEVVFHNLPLLFALGIAGGLAKDRDISAGLAGALSYLTVDAVSKVVNPENNLAVLGGVIGGLIGGYSYINFSKVRLPVFLSFFGGKRFVPIIAGMMSVVIGFLFGHMWPVINQGIFNVALWVTDRGAYGIFVYGLLNRVLIPFGLQHIIEKFAYFMLPGAPPFTDAVTGKVIVGDLHRFFAGDPTAGMFMSGFYPIMIFGLPAAALAMYLSAPKKRRPAVFGLLFSAALTSMLTGVTEPIEFSFLFVAPLLYFVHAIFMGLSFALAHLVDLRAGFTFSGGLIDMVLSWKLFNNPSFILILGSMFFTAYFLVFYVLIYLLNLKTPGRDEKSLIFAGGVGTASSSTDKNQKYKDLAPLYVEALGGKDNFKEITNCVTRLRIKLKDTSKVDSDKVKSFGSMGVVIMSDTVQVVIGADVEFLAAEMKSELGFS